MRLAVIPRGRSLLAPGTLQGTLEAGLSRAGEQQVVDLARKLATEGIATVGHAPDRGSARTAQLFAGVTGARLVRLDALRDVHLGHWEGMPFATARERFRAPFQTWVGEPRVTTPPAGEPLALAESRLRSGLESFRKGKAPAVAAFVVPPLAEALLCGILSGSPLARIEPEIFSPPALEVRWFEV